MFTQTMDQVQLATEILGSRWKILILQILLTGKKRFNQLLDEVKGITPKMLSKELKDMEYAGIIERKQYNTIPPKVEYNIQHYNGELQALIKAFANFAETYYEQQEFQRKQIPDRIDFVI